MNHVVFLFGPSCSGKSTLGKALAHHLGKEWTYIDRDVFIENGDCCDSDANLKVDEIIQSIAGYVIVDAQIPWRSKKIGEWYFVILPPLEILLERDSKRTVRLQRSEQRAHYAKEYVIETHEKLSGMKSDFDYSFDSSVLSIKEELGIVETFLKHE